MEAALSLRSFTEEDELGIPQYGNFYLMFVEINNTPHRSSPAFLRFKAEHPALEELVTKKITEASRKINGAESAAKALRPYKSCLYAAYMFMREYVASDEELFR